MTFIIVIPFGYQYKNNFYSRLNHSLFNAEDRTHEVVDATMDTMATAAGNETGVLSL